MSDANTDTTNKRNGSIKGLFIAVFVIGVGLFAGLPIEVCIVIVVLGYLFLRYLGSSPTHKNYVHHKVKELLTAYQQTIYDYESITKEQDQSKKQTVEVEGRTIRYQDYKVALAVIEAWGHLFHFSELSKELVGRDKEGILAYVGEFEAKVAGIKKAVLASLKPKVKKKKKSKKPKKKKVVSPKELSEEAKRKLAEQEERHQKELAAIEQQLEEERLARERAEFLPFDDVIVSETDQAKLLQDHTGSDDADTRRFIGNLINREERQGFAEEKQEFAKEKTHFELDKRVFDIEQYVVKQLHIFKEKELDIKEQMFMLLVREQQIDIQLKFLDLRELAFELKVERKELELLQRIADFEHEMRERELRISNGMLDLRNFELDLNTQQSALYLDEKSLGLKRQAVTLDQKRVAMDRYRNEIYNEEQNLALDYKQKSIRLQKETLNIKEGKVKNEAQRLLNKIDKSRNQSDNVLAKIGLEKQGIGNYFDKLLVGLGYKYNQVNAIQQKNAMQQTLMNKDYKYQQLQNRSAQQSMNAQTKYNRLYSNFDTSQRKSYMERDKLHGQVYMLKQDIAYEKSKNKKHY